MSSVYEMNLPMDKIELGVYYFLDIISDSYIQVNIIRTMSSPPMRRLRLLVPSEMEEEDISYTVHQQVVPVFSPKYCA